MFQMITMAAWQEKLIVKGSSNYDPGLELSGILYMSLCRQLLVKADGEFFDYKKQPSRIVHGTHSCTISPTQSLQPLAFSILK